MIDYHPMELKVTTLNPEHNRKCTLTSLEEQWLEAYINLGNATKACESIGVTENPAQRGSEFKRRLMPFIEANMKKMIGKCAPAALMTVFEIAQDCPDPAVRLKAAQDLLDRAGHKQAVQHEIMVSDKSDDEIDREIKRLLKQGGIVEAEILQ